MVRFVILGPSPFPISKRAEANDDRVRESGPPSVQSDCCGISYRPCHHSASHEVILSRHATPPLAPLWPRKWSPPSPRSTNHELANDSHSKRIIRLPCDRSPPPNRRRVWADWFGTILSGLGHPRTSSWNARDRVAVSNHNLVPQCAWYEVKTGQQTAFWSLMCQDCGEDAPFADASLGILHHLLQFATEIFATPYHGVSPAERFSAASFIIPANLFRTGHFCLWRAGWQGGSESSAGDHGSRDPGG